MTSRLRKARVRLLNPLADIRFGEGCRLGPGFSLSAPWGGSAHLGADTEFRRDCRIELEGPDSRLEIGKGCHFTYGAVIQCGRSISIGDRATFAQAALIVDGSHRFRDLSQPAVDQGYEFRPITIGDDVMAMAKTTIIASVGTRAFVGANSVVTKEIPPYSLAVGSPAKVIESFAPPS